MSVSIENGVPESFPRFMISNDGYVTLHDVSFACHIQQMVVGSFSIEGFEVRPNDVVRPIGLVKPTEKARAYGCGYGSEDDAVITGGPLISADIQIVIEFRPSPLPWPLLRWPYRFVARREQGILVWTPQPVDA
jgi:hypothetical protein